MTSGKLFKNSATVRAHSTAAHFSPGYIRPHHRRRLVQVFGQVTDAVHPLDVQGGAGAEGDPKEGRLEGLPVLLRHLQVTSVYPLQQPI